VFVIPSCCDFSEVVEEDVLNKFQCSSDLVVFTRLVCGEWNASSSKIDVLNNVGWWGLRGVLGE